MSPKRILLISGYYPPQAPTASVRAPKFARYLLDRGHDVRVLSALNPQFPAALDPEVEPCRLTAVPYYRPGLRPVSADASKPVASTNTQKPAVRTETPPWLLKLKLLYRQLRMLPDPHVGWIKPAIAAAEAMRTSWSPDVIFATGPPFSGLLVAQHLSRRWGTPFIIELRDLWSDDIYQNIAPVAGWLNRRLEVRVGCDAAACVAVTAANATLLAARHGKPTILAYNGYDPADFTGLETVAPLDGERLTILHAGSVYGGRRSPATFLQALAKLGPDVSAIRALFIGEDVDSVAHQATALGVTGVVDIGGAMPRAEILRLERAADMLLMVRFDYPAERDVIPGKLFEYIGARRPILVTGATEGEAADIVRNNDLGLVSNDPDAIAAHLRSCIAAKRRDGRVPDLDATRAKAFERSIQYQKIAEVIEEMTTV